MIKRRRLWPRLHRRSSGEAGEPATVALWAARRGAWAGSEWTGASVEPCGLAAASPARSAKQTSAVRHASSGGRRKCCSRFPRCAP